MNGYDLILHFINLQYFYVTVDKMASFENENASQLNQQPIQAAPAPTHQLSLKDRILARIMSVPDDEDGHADKGLFISNARRHSVTPVILRHLSRLSTGR
jgi:hypothetical protein